MTLLQKVISSTSIGGDSTNGGGLLNPQQSGRFIDYMWEATTLGSQVRTIPMGTNDVELNRMAIGERLVRVATEAVDDGVNNAVAFTKVSLGSVKFRMDWELSEESLEDGLEGEALESHIARLMATQASNDLEDLAINGDTIGHTLDPLLKGLDGWRKRLYYGGTVLDASGITLPDGSGAGELHRGTFNAALRAMPRRYNGNRGRLRFLTATGLLQDYMFREQLYDQGGFPQRNRENPGGGQGGNNNPNANAGWSPTSPYGVNAQEVPLFPEYDIDLDGSGSGTASGRGSDLWLVDPQNLIWGVRREIKVVREYKPKKDTIEYTMFTRVGCNVENPQASVVVKNVKYVS